MIVWAQSGDLVLDADGDVWQRHRNGWRELGPILRADAPVPHYNDVVSTLDFHRLLALWLDRFDPRAEQLAAFRLSQRTH